ncbi:hypothetical protein [uncultured Methylobacterium sp.]|uniref:hypothetical protein n=1 Tax=uncultured Methylobacterium sp. TaxID=157278 RepID=UPI0035CA5069
MSEQDSLRLVAEVVDKFSSPLKALRAQLQGMSRDGASHSEVVAKGLNRVESAAKSAGQTASTVLNPALAAIGITGLGVVAAMTGVGSAMRSLGGSVSALATLGRETGVSAENLRVLQSVMGKFGIEADASAGAIKNFAQNMRLAKDGIGPIMEFLRTQGKTTEGRAYFNQLADSLKNSKDNGEALMKALEGLEHIQDPAGRMTYAQQIFGNADIGRLGDQHLGRLRDVIEKQRKLLGPLSEGTVKAAEDFDRAMSALSTTMQKLGTAIATEAMPYLSEFVKGIQGLVDGGRQDVTGQLRESVRAIGEALREIDWTKAGKDAGEFLNGVTDGAKALVEAVKEVATILRSLNEGKYMDALRGADGARGPLARRLAPKVGDDEVAAQEKIDSIKKEADLTRSITGRPAAPMAAELQGRLSQAEAELQALRDRSPEQRQRALAEAPLQDRITGIQRQLQNFDAMSAGGTASAIATKRAEDLRREMGKLTDELRRLRDAMPEKKPGEATVDKMSAEGNGLFPGARIQTAGYGGGGGAIGSMGRVGNMLARRGGGIYLPEGGGGGQGGIPRISPRPGGPGEQVGRALRGEAPESAPTDRGMLDLIAKAEGTTKRGYDDSFAHQLKGTLTDKSLGEIEQIQRGMRGSSAIGKYQFMRNTLFGSRGRPGLVDQLGIDRDERFTPALQDRMANALIERRYKEAQRNHARQGGDFMSHFRTSLAREWASFPGDYGQKGINGGMYSGQRASVGRDRLTGAARRWLDGREGRTAKAGPRETADGEGFAARQRAMRDFNSSTSAIPGLGSDGGRSMLQKALKGPIGGGFRGDVNGSVQVHVAKPGPDTRVSTSASGNLFRDVKLNGGKTMAEASQEN